MKTLKENNREVCSKQSKQLTSNVLLFKEAGNKQQMRNIGSKAMTVGKSLVVVQSFLDLRLRGVGGASPAPPFSSDACTQIHS